MSRKNDEACPVPSIISKTTFSNFLFRILHPIYLIMLTLLINIFLDRCRDETRPVTYAPSTEGDDDDDGNMLQQGRLDPQYNTNSYDNYQQDTSYKY